MKPRVEQAINKSYCLKNDNYGHFDASKYVFEPLSRTNAHTAEPYRREVIKNKTLPQPSYFVISKKMISDERRDKTEMASPQNVTRPRGRITMQIYFLIALNIFTTISTRSFTCVSFETIMLIANVGRTSVARAIIYN